MLIILWFSPQGEGKACSRGGLEDILLFVPLFVFPLVHPKYGSGRLLAQWLVGVEERDFADINGCIYMNILQGSDVQRVAKGTMKSGGLLRHSHPSTGLSEKAG